MTSSSRLTADHYKAFSCGGSETPGGLSNSVADASSRGCRSSMSGEPPSPSWGIQSSGMSVVSDEPSQWRRRSSAFTPVPPCQRRLSVKGLEARQAFQKRLVQAAANNITAAAKAIWRFYARRIELRKVREAMRLRREAAVRAHIADYRRERALARFRAVVKRYMRLVNHPAQQRRWRRIQARWRGIVARRQFAAMQSAQVTVEGEACCVNQRWSATRRIQSAWRSFKSRLSSGVDVAAYLNVRRRHAARVVQRFVRWVILRQPWAARNAQAAMLLAWCSATRVQRAWRRHCVIRNDRIANFRRKHRLYVAGL